jgi:hypothetical protein
MQGYTWRVSNYKRMKACQRVIDDLIKSKRGK